MGRGNGKGKGTPPANSDDTLSKPKHADSDGYPVLSLRHLRKGYGIEELTEKQQSEFLVKWAKRSQMTWKDLIHHPKHGLGYEFLPKDKIKKVAPDHLSQEKYMVLRHEGNLPIVGFKAGDIFYPLWVEATYGDVYKH